MTMMMNKKAKFALAALVVFACLLGQGEAVAEASFQIPVSVEEQEKIARNLSRNIKPATADDVQELRPPLIVQQKRVMDYNGLELSEQPLQHSSDYKTKVRPAELMTDPQWAGISVGAGRIFIDADAQKWFGGQQPEYQPL